MISDCQQLYPDSDLSSDSEEEETDLMPTEEEETNLMPTEEYFNTVEGMQHLSIEGQSTLTHLEHVLIQSHGLENG